ncbi:MAG: MASE3 domain-containing protein, partial [Wenzhouxiangella sp.]|nr:MASE3 domain-containing protein [Wenzhouxiangella sp.]
MTDRGSPNPLARPAGYQVPIILALLLAVLMAFPPALPQDFDLYLPLHSAFEIGSSAVAGLVFVVGWLSFQRRAPVSVLLIAVTFLGVALLDVGHLLSFQGMPDFVTPAGSEKAIRFWLGARLLAAAGMALAVIVPWNQEPAPGWLRTTLLGLTLALVAALYTLILRVPERLPDTFDPEQGLTTFKIGAEYAVIALHLTTVGALWLQRRAIPHIDSRNLIVALLIIMLSEVFFTLYVSVTDSFNLIGHVYKIIAYFYLFQAVVVSGIEQPYRELAGAKARLRATLEALPDIIFELDRRGVIHQMHSRYPHLLAQPEDVRGHCLLDYLPEPVQREYHKLLDDIDRNGRSGAYQYKLEADGETRDYEATGNLLRDPETPEARYIVIVQDITQRKRLDHELRIAAAAFESQESICITDEEHRILRVNSAFTRVTGFEEFEMVGKDPALLLPEDDRAGFRQRMDERMKGRSRWRGEIRLRRKSGEVHSQLLLVTAVR